MYFLEAKKWLPKYLLTLMLIYFISSSLTAHSLEKTTYEYGYTAQEQETLQWLWQKAQQFSGIQSIYHVDCPYHLPIYIMTKSTMNREMCPDDPQHCRNFVGAYDTGEKRILLHNGLLPEDDIISASFLLHEFVHALQNETISDEGMSGSCSRLRIVEQEAYDVQNAFLKSEGAFFRAGVGMRLMVCPEDRSYRVGFNQGDY